MNITFVLMTKDESVSLIVLDERNNLFVELQIKKILNILRNVFQIDNGYWYNLNQSFSIGAAGY